MKVVSTIFFFTILICGILESNCQNRICIDLDNTLKEPKLIEDLGSSFELFNIAEPIAGLDDWGEHWITGDLIVFYSVKKGNSKNSNSFNSSFYTFIAFSISESQEEFRFDLPDMYSKPKMVHKLNEKGPLVILFGDGNIITFEPTEKKIQKHSTGVRIYTSLRLSSGNAIILGAIENNNMEYPCFIKLDPYGKVINTEIKKSFKRQVCLNNHHETILKYRNKLYWYNVANSTIYQLDQNLRILDSIVLELPNLITYKELSDPSIFDKFRINKFPGKTYIKKMCLINSTLLLSFISDGQEYSSFVSLDTNKSSTIKGLRTLMGKSGVTIFPLRVSEDSNISMEISRKTENFILSNSNLNIRANGPSVFYIK